MIYNRIGESRTGSPSTDRQAVEEGKSRRCADAHMQEAGADHTLQYDRTVLVEQQGANKRPAAKARDTVG